MDSMTNEEVMRLMTDMGLHEGGMDNWVPDNAWVLFAQKVTTSELRRLYELNAELLEALKTAMQAFTEIRHAHRLLEEWFTGGERAATQHLIMWQQRGIEGVIAAITKAEEKS